MKTEGLDLSNHLTGWNALCRVWDEHGEHRARWTFMGYGTKGCRLISRREYLVLIMAQEAKCLLYWMNGSLLVYEKLLMNDYYE